MIYLRKIFGIFLLIFSLVLTLSFIISLPNSINDIPAESGPERSGSIAGVGIFALFIVWLIYFMIKRGIRLLKPKPQNEIEQIGHL